MGTQKVKCFIVSGAPDSDIDFIKSHINNDAFIIAADSGYIKCLDSGIIPDVIIGDFDSSQCPNLDAEIVTLPHEKDDTDTFFCVKYAINQGFTDIEILSAIGGREDHNYANILCLEYCRQNNIKCAVVNRMNKLFLTDSTAVINNSEYKYFSVFAFMGTASGISIENAAYPLKNAVFEPYHQRGVSNELMGKPAQISVKKGILLIILSND